VAIPDGHAVAGVVLSDQLRTMSWPERNVEIIGTAPRALIDDVREKLAALLGIE